MLRPHSAWPGPNSNAVNYASAPQTDFTVHFGQISEAELAKILIKCPTISTAFPVPRGPPRTCGTAVRPQMCVFNIRLVLNDLALTGAIKFKETCMTELLHINYKYLLAIKITFRGSHLRWLRPNLCFPRSEDSLRDEEATAPCPSRGGQAELERQTRVPARQPRDLVQSHTEETR